MLPRLSSWHQREAAWRDRKKKKKIKTGMWWTLSWRMCHADNAGALSSEQKGSATHLLWHLCTSNKSTSGRVGIPPPPPAPQMRIQEGDRCETAIHHTQTNNNFASLSAAVCTRDIGAMGQRANTKPNQLGGRENSGPSPHRHVAVCFFIHWNDHSPCLPKDDRASGVGMPCGPHF